MLEQGRPGFVEMFAQPDRPAGSAFEQISKELLALDQRQASEVLAVEVQQVEHVIGHAVGAAVGEVLL
jgi:hypothetical protein